MRVQSKLDSTSALQRPTRSTLKWPVQRREKLAASTVEDLLTIEEPLEIQLGYGPVQERAVKSISVTMRTPGHDFDLAAGFLMSEGIIREPADIQETRYISAALRQPLRPDGGEETILPPSAVQNVLRVELAPDVRVSLSTLERNFYTTSSCGICGKASLLALQTACPPRLKNDFAFSTELLYTLPAKLRQEQQIFQHTGGLHAAALFDAAGTLLGLREDVGRHNAVDKLLGAELLVDRVPLRDALLLLSGRASFELLQKALMAGIPMVASVGAPSSLAVEVACRFDITLIGFLRDECCNIYHGAEHLL